MKSEELIVRVVEDIGSSDGVEVPVEELKEREYMINVIVPLADGRIGARVSPCRPFKRRKYLEGN